MIKTGKVTDRRRLRFGRMEDILRDVEWLNERVENGAKLRATGNWTPAQVIDHVSKNIAFSLDGFPPGIRAPLPVRLLLKLKKPSLLLKPMKPGIMVKGRAGQALAPDADVIWGQAVTRLRNIIARLQKGERMLQAHPAFGALVHEEWIQLHCRHAEMHLSFIHAG